MKSIAAASLLLICSSLSQTLSAQVDTIKPTVNLLGITTVNVPYGAEYVDPPVALEDNISTDAQMRPSLTITISLPKNRAGNCFCPAAGLFTVHYRVTDLANNQSDDAVRLINCGSPPTGVKSNSVPGLFTVYPNPGNGLFHIDIHEAGFNDANIVITDLVGKDVFTQIVRKGDDAANIDMRGVPSGIYFVKVQSGDKVFVKKIELN